MVQQLLKHTIVSIYQSVNNGNRLVHTNIINVLSLEYNQNEHRKKRWLILLIVRIVCVCVVGIYSRKFDVFWVDSLMSTQTTAASLNYNLSRASYIILRHENKNIYMKMPNKILLHIIWCLNEFFWITNMWNSSINRVLFRC